MPEFEALTAEEVLPGEPVKSEIVDKVRTNLDNHEERIGAAETAITTRPAFSFDVIGVLTPPFDVEQILKDRPGYAFKATGVRLYPGRAGTSGEVTVDIEYKRGAGAWTSILNEPLTLDYSEGDEGIASGSLAVTDFQAGDWFRLNVLSVQDGMEDIYVKLENEVV